MKASDDFATAKRGPVVEHAGKSRITIFLDDDVLAEFRERAAAGGKGYQTLINEALRRAITPDSAPVTVESLRRVLREELHAA